MSLSSENDRSTHKKVASTQGGKSSTISRRLIGRELALGTFFGIALGVIGVLVTLITTTSSENLRHSGIVLSLALAVSTLTIVIVLQRFESKHLLSDIDKLTNQSGSLASQLDKAVGRVAGATLDHQRISKQFGTLIRRQKAFEAAVTEYLWNASIKNDVAPQWRKAKREYQQLLNCLCETAQYALATKRGLLPEVCSANIKQVVLHDGQMVYRVEARSPGCPPERADADDHTRSRYFKVRDNKMYSAILQNRKHLHITDIDAYLASMNANEGFTEPSAVAATFYKSCLVLPIYGEDRILHGLGENERTMDFGQNESLIGLFCVDSQHLSFFDDLYDLDVMRQLSDQAFSAIRALVAIRALRKKTGIAP